MMKTLTSTLAFSILEKVLIYVQRDEVLVLMCSGGGNEFADDDEGRFILFDEP